MAMRFYAARQRDAVAVHQDSAAAFYREAAEYYGAQSWWTRAGAGGPAPMANGTESAPLPPPDAVLRAAEAVVVCGVPCLRGDYVEEARAITHERLRRPVVFVDNVAVADLWVRVRWPARAGDVVRLWSTEVGRETALRALACLWQMKLIRA
jgi:hypothetical protein